MESSSPPQSELGGSSGYFGSGSWNVTLKLKQTKEERKNLKKEKNQIITVLDDPRHFTNGVPELYYSKKIAKWRMRERMKTVMVSLVYCLNIGVDPPDSLKTDPCAREECWINPTSVPPQKALENIGKALQSQYERWQPRARYKLSLDPTVEEVKKLCLSLRRNAKDERVLFHYNGHGVPKPTTNGEIWVFNKTFTQYIPLSIYELQTWMGSPSIYVFDCSAAGLIVHWFIQFAEQREKEYERMIQSSSTATSASSVLPIKDFIILAACGSNEILPMNPTLPADVFTACLTTPIKMALRWFCNTSLLVKKGINFDLVDKIPGRLADRKTPIGELNWIFTAITDTIAWNVLPRDLFQKLFRQDLLVASLFRNFLLAERIMRPLNCNPISHPVLPETHLHPMWQAWDLAVDICLSQIPDMLENPSVEYKNSPFFTEQLTAFEVWLEFGNERKPPPEQLPIVLQVLLSQTHRLRALVLLAKFLDLGPWAVNLALSVGIFPYVLRLLQSAAVELRQVLVFIWTKILALDKSCQLDLVKDNGHNYFLSVLSTTTISADQRIMSAFILSVISNNCRPGQSACLNGNLVSICLSQLNDPDPILRRWLVLCVAKLWESFEDAKWAGIKENAIEKLCTLLTDRVPEVRAAAVYALALFIGGADGNEQRTSIEMNIGLTLPIVSEDASPIVRKELIIALSKFVVCYEQSFKEVIQEILKEQQLAEKERERLAEMSKDKSKVRVSKSEIPLPSNQNNNTSPPVSNYKQQQSSIYALLWKLVITLSQDAFPQVARMADLVIKRLIPTRASNPLYRSTSLENEKKSKITKTKTKFSQLLSRSSVGTKNPNVNNNSLNASPPGAGIFTSPSPIKRGKSIDHNRSHMQMEEDMNTNNELPSVFYDWSCEHFSKQLLISPVNTNEDDENYATFAEKIWRNKRIQNTVHYSAVKVRAFEHDITFGPHKPKLDEQVAIIDNSPDGTSNLLLHPYEPTIVVADERDGISVWDRELCNKLNMFKNRSHNDVLPFSRTTNMTLINETSSSLLALASDDGIVRIWSNYDDPYRCKLTSSFRSFLGFIPNSKGAGLVMKWSQENSNLITSGDIGTIRVWDLERELRIQDIPSNSETCVTCVDTHPSKTVVAGYGDGSIRLFDFRMPSKYSLAMTFFEHKEWIVNLHINKTNPNNIISGSTSGHVKFWDVNSNSSLSTVEPFNKYLMTAFAVHNTAPVFVCGSQNQKIKVYNFAGQEISLIRYHDGFLGQRIGPVSSLAFHPHLLLFGAGSTDSIVSLYSRPTAKK